MPCYQPIKGWFSRNRSATGKRSVVFNAKDGLNDLPIDIPCGQCIGCRLEKSREWAMRMVHEASLHEENCFVTLTYNDENLPSDYSLDKRHFQLFMKKLRKTTGAKIRYYHCGEYGDHNNRPHYHACLFGYSFPDKVLWSVRDGCRLYISELLNSIWGLGYCTIGDVTFESAAYVARYVTKKITGSQAKEHYQVCDPETGQIHQLEPEYATMSRRPGIGKGWYDKFKGDAYPSDFLVMRGSKMRPPKFYDLLYEAEDPEGMKDIKRERLVKQTLAKEDNTTRRLYDKETVKKAQFKQLKRGVEEL